MNHDMGRRDFLGVLGASVASATRAGPACAASRPVAEQVTLADQWRNPPVEFSIAPFWFWNDELSEDEIARQLDDFQAHGVHGFVIHPRVGLPRSIGWLSEHMIHFMRFAIEQAAARDTWVVLYDEGMYPSGSSSGQVVAENPAFKCRGLVCVDLDEAQPGSEQQRIRIGADGEPALAPDQHLVAIVRRKTNGHRVAVVDRPVKAIIRGLHYIEDDPPRLPDGGYPPEDEPPAADLLNPEAVACFIRLVYQRYYDEFSEHFGKTVPAIFTDEPGLLGKLREKGVVAGTTGVLDHVNMWLGYDFTPRLPALWYKDEPEADRYRRDYHRALQARMEETYYKPISNWCAEHGIALTGHPARPDDIGHLRYFDMPGQDIVWRYIEPSKPSALEGAQSTQGKCASSAMIHLGRRRNGNEFCGAYGHEFTFEEMKWLANWLIVRGCNLFFPHAFYYSVRGPRIDERPPDVGPNSPWWDQYKPFADACRRLCWLNTDIKHVCELAILGRNDYLPWRAAKVCFQHQRDFNYIEARHLWEDAKVAADGIRIAGMHYRALIVEDEPLEKAKPALETLDKAGRVIRWKEGMSDSDLLRGINRLTQPDVRVRPEAPGLRVRHVVKHGSDYYILFNEGEEDLNVQLQLSVDGRRFLLDPKTGERQASERDAPVQLARHALKVFMIAKG